MGDEAKAGSAGSALTAPPSDGAGSANTNGAAGAQVPAGGAASADDQKQQTGAAAGAEASDKTTSEGQQTDATEGGKPKGDEPATEIEFKLPDGVEADAELFGKFKPLAKDLGLKSEGAQKLVDLFVEGQKRWAEQAVDQWTQQDKAWTDTLRTDKELGGADAQAKLNVARKAIQRFGGDELRKALDDLGIGNHPALVRFAYRVGQQISEDSIAGARGTGGVQPKQLGDLFDKSLPPA